MVGTAVCDKYVRSHVCTCTCTCTLHGLEFTQPPWNGTWYPTDYTCVCTCMYSIYPAVQTTNSIIPVLSSLRIGSNQRRHYTILFSFHILSLRNIQSDAHCITLHVHVHGIHVHGTIYIFLEKKGKVTLP